MSAGTARRAALVNVMTPGERGVVLALVAGYAPEVFDRAVAAYAETFPAELAARLEAAR